MRVTVEKYLDGNTYGSLERFGPLLLAVLVFLSMVTLLTFQVIQLPYDESYAIASMLYHNLPVVAVFLLYMMLWIGAHVYLHVV